MKFMTKVFVALAALAPACHKSTIDNKQLKDFQQVNLVANNAAYNPSHVDSTLQNAWGLAFSSTGIPWVNSNGGHVSEVYSAEGAILRAPVAIPGPGGAPGGVPSGIVFSGGKGFKLSNGQASNFLFVGEDGVLSGWNGAAGNAALLIKDNSATSSYKGLALAAKGGANYIYAANFKTGRIDVWDTTFAPVTMNFRDFAIPSGYAPFNIQSIGSWLFVTYAKVGPDGDDVAGPGNGFVDIFNTDGSFVRRLASRGALNSPWGVTAAGPTFLDDNNMSMDEGEAHGSNSGKGRGGHDNEVDSVLLVGNFGDGRINVFGQDGTFLGQLQSHSHTIVIDGLWALSFAPSTSTVDPSRLYFTAGPAKEMDGLFGYLIKQ